MTQHSESVAAGKATRQTEILTPGLTPAEAARVKGKPAKPHPDFPLFPHASRRWAKKVRGEMCYFGPWYDANGESNAQAAIEKWLDEKDSLLAGRKPRKKGDEGLLVGDPPSKPKSAVGLVNRFLTAKSSLLAQGEITRRTFEDYKTTCTRLVSELGWSTRVDDLLPEDFEKLRASIGATRGPVALGNEINRIRIVFRYATENLLVGSVKFGQSFKRPSKKTLRIEKKKRGPRTFEAAEIRQMIQKASQPLKTMILLGINAGLGQSDIAQLPETAIDFRAGWLNFPRPKTGVDRRAKLWPETLAALREAIAARPTAADQSDAGLMFVTRCGARWSRIKINDEGTKAEKAIVICATTGEFSKLLTSLGIGGGRGFYSLRRGFETVGGDSRDQVAVDYVMGHAPESDDMAAIYRDGLNDDRLKDVAEHVRKWLFPKKKKPR